MHTDPVAFFREDFPALFHRGVEQLKEAAAAGDAKAKARLEDTSAAKGAVRLRFEGADGAELWLGVQGGTMTVTDAAPDGLPVRMAVAAPTGAARAALEEIDAADVFEDARAPLRVARSASLETERLLEGHRLEFHLTVTDLPAEPSEVTLRVGIGVSEPPSDPKFTVGVSWDDIEDLRDGELAPQQLFGRLKITGDATQAMALGMSLLQRRA